MPVIGFPDVCADGTEVIGDYTIAQVWFDATNIATPSGERALFLRAALAGTTAVCVYKGAVTDVGFILNELGTEVTLGPTFGNSCVGIRTVTGGCEAFWIESQTVYKSRRFSAVLAPLEAAQSHSVPASLVGHMGTGFLDLDRNGVPLWTDANRAATVQGIPLLYPSRAGQWWVGQLGGGFADQIVAVNGVTGKRGTLYDGLGFEPHATLANDGSGDIYVAFRTLGSIGATFVTMPPVPAFTGTVAEQAQNATSPSLMVPSVHPMTHQTNGLANTPWVAYFEAISQKLSQPIDLAANVVGILPVTNMGVGDAGPNTVLIGDGTFGPAAGTGGTGDVVGPASSVNSQIALFNGVTGKLLKSATGTGFVKVTSGVMLTPSTTVALASEVSGRLPFANVAQGSALSVLGVTGNATADEASIVAGTDHQVMRRSGTSVSWGAVNLAQSAAVTGILPVANGGTIPPIVVTLTNANVLALPTTPFQLVAAPGAGFYIAWAWIELWTKFAAGAYTGLNATYCVLSVALSGGASQSINIVNDSTTVPPLTMLTRLMGAASRHTRIIPYLEAVGSGELYIIGSTADGSLGIDAVADVEDKALVLFADNNGSGVFTGGNAANTLVATVFYAIRAVP